MASKIRSVHIVTVGYNTALRYEQMVRNRAISETELEAEMGKLTEAERFVYSRKLEEFLKEKAKGDLLPEASEELYAIKRYLGEISLVYLTHTDTHVQRCCAKALANYLTDLGVRVSASFEIAGLHDASTFQDGLVNLMKKLTELILAHRGESRICATGGYKPEVVVASIVGMMSQTPVYYIHECFPREVHLPALPIGWRWDVRESEEAFDALTYAPSPGIKREDFIDAYGYETYRDFTDSWLVEEDGGYLTPNRITKTILETMRAFTRVR